MCKCTFTAFNDVKNVLLLRCFAVIEAIYMTKNEIRPTNLTRRVVKWFFMSFPSSEMHCTVIIMIPSITFITRAASVFSAMQFFT